MKRIISSLIITVIALILSFVVHMIAYQFDFTYYSVSDSLFVIGMILFFVGIIFITNASFIFNGLTYAFRVLWFPKFKEQYASYKDYKDEHQHKRNSFFALEALIIAFVFIGVAYILSTIQ
jgi:uncharacterized membrane protein YGL010W